MAKDTGEFKVTLTGAGLNLSRSVNETVAQQIVGLVLGGVTVGPAPTGGQVTPQAQQLPQGMTPKTFMAQKRPATDIERVTCLAWFLANERNTTSFKTKDLIELNREAAQFQLSNASATARNAVTDGFLAPSGGGKKQITARGEALVAALPDREKVKSALENHPKARRRKSSSKTAKK